MHVMNACKTWGNDLKELEFNPVGHGCLKYTFNSVEMEILHYSWYCDACCTNYRVYGYDFV